ncbi:unnamed protein product [Caenorhabditis auriculariae]|uniref:Uncharacterized protein n=1 Tax=Caenorhabditis auriculariae TaxID=2777116 RepID=A0A8S1GYY9_9PELO|nr:unnamed protein product [Caenorhabditis auriculariae]
MIIHLGSRRPSIKVASERFLGSRVLEKLYEAENRFSQACDRTKNATNLPYQQYPNKRNCLSHLQTLNSSLLTGSQPLSSASDSVNCRFASLLHLRVSKKCHQTAKIEALEAEKQLVSRTMAVSPNVMPSEQSLGKPNDSPRVFNWPSVFLFSR